MITAVSSHQRNHTVEDEGVLSFVYYNVRKEFNGNPLFTFRGDISCNFPAEARYRGRSRSELREITSSVSTLQYDRAVTSQLTLNLGLRWYYDIGHAEQRLRHATRGARGDRIVRVQCQLFHRWRRSPSVLWRTTAQVWRRLTISPDKVARWPSADSAAITTVSLLQFHARRAFSPAISPFARSSSRVTVASATEFRRSSVIRHT